MCNDNNDYDDIDFQIEQDERDGKTVEDILEEEIEALIDLGRGHGLMGEDIQRVLTKLLNREADRNRDKFKLH